MFITAFVMSLAAQMNAVALDYSVGATVPAPIPSGSPTIDSPQNNSSTSDSEIEVSGTCPVVAPAIIVAIYDRGTHLLGSIQCSMAGTYSMPVTLSMGEHSLVATVVTITGGIGNSSAPTIITRNQQTPSVITPDTIEPDQPQIESLNSLTLPLHVIAKDVYIVMGSDGNAVWRGTFEGGTAPYSVEIEWGDGKTEKRTVGDSSEQTFSHKYENLQSYSVTIRVTDANGMSSVFNSTAVTFVVKQVASLDKTLPPQIPAPIAFVEKNAVQILAGATSALVFLWYLESGRHVLAAGKIIGGMGHIWKH